MTVPELTVKLIDQRDVPARETGLLLELSVREGSQITKGQILGKMDDRQALLEEKLAATQMSVATKQAENFHASDMAEKDFDQQQELNEQQKLLNDIAHRKAGNRVRILAAQKAEAVAKNELARATRARQEFVDSVSSSEIDGLRLAQQRLELEAQQAEFERQIDSLTAKSEDRASKIQSISVQRSQIALDQAVLDQDIARLQATASEYTQNLAELAVERHRVISPIDGIVVHRYQQPGEWVKSGDPILRVVRLDRLRAEGFIRTRLLKRLRQQDQVTLVRQSEDGTTTIRHGEVVFISPEVDPVNDEVAFWVEFDNADQKILPGMRMGMTSELR
jgi:multidrug efflux pump subunit AcrA (membrane-fusion protein)